MKIAAANIYLHVRILVRGQVFHRTVVDEGVVVLVAVGHSTRLLGVLVVPALDGLLIEQAKTCGGIHHAPHIGLLLIMLTERHKQAVWKQETTDVRTKLQYMQT